MIGVGRCAYKSRPDPRVLRCKPGFAEENAMASALLYGPFQPAKGPPMFTRILVGTKNEVADGIARYRERLGMDLLVVRTEVPGASEAEREASLESLATLAS